MSAEEIRLIRWLLVAIVAGALLLALLAYLGLPFTPMFAATLIGRFHEIRTSPH
jgi:hypothetical protein